MLIRLRQASHVLSDLRFSLDTKVHFMRKPASLVLRSHGINDHFDEVDAEVSKTYELGPKDGVVHGPPLSSLVPVVDGVGASLLSKICSTLGASESEATVDTLWPGKVLDTLS